MNSNPVGRFGLMKGRRSPILPVVLLSAGDANRIGPALLQRLSEEP